MVAVVPRPGGPDVSAFREDDFLGDLATFSSPRPVGAGRIRRYRGLGGRASAWGRGSLVVALDAGGGVGVRDRDTRGGWLLRQRRPSGDGALGAVTAWSSCPDRSPRRPGVASAA